MSIMDFSGEVWRKSSRSSGGNNDNCVELANAADVIAVRDSKNPDGPALSWPSANWQGFLNKLVV